LSLRPHAVVLLVSLACMHIWNTLDMSSVTYPHVALIVLIDRESVSPGIFAHT
jgi:hypothetical protein